MAYAMADTLKIGDKGIDATVTWLASCQETVLIESTENVASYQSKGIDLLWSYLKDNKVINRTIEVKADTYFQTGNYFFETVSNTTLNTEGCFLYSQADYMFYCFVDKEIHIFNLPEVRQWFLQNKHSFKQKMTHTRIGGAVVYSTIGYLIPRSMLIDSIPQHLKIIKFNTTEDVK
jgi:hypothetical protein